METTMTVVWTYSILPRIQLVESTKMFAYSIRKFTHHIIIIFTLHSYLCDRTSCYSGGLSIGLTQSMLQQYSRLKY